MEPYTGDWSARRGTYRIRYRFDEKIVTILSIKPRSTAYHA
jgi:mRNA-degrading endonuclease RelE of RelBE toxin-antitoxin system